MFDLLMNGMIAYQQVLALIGSFFLLGISSVLTWDGLHSHVNAWRVDGTIVGVREKNGVYYSVYSYTLPNGETREATDNSGSNIVKGRETGSHITLLVSRDDPQKARPAKNTLEYVIAALFALPGGFLLWYGLVAYPLTPLTGVILLGFCIYGAYRFKTHMIPRNERLSPSAWMAARQVERKKEMESHPVRPLEELLNTPEKQIEREKQQRTARAAAPLLLLFAAGLIYFGYTEYKTVTNLEETGLRATGTVVRLDTHSNSKGTSYYPIVSFTDKNGYSFTFKSSFGSSPPMYRTGETVTVLYDAETPQSSAQIDHGIWNKLVPAGIGFIGLMLALLGLRLLS